MTEVSIKYLSNIFKAFKNLTYERYKRNRYKHIPTDSYFYPERKLAKYMMRNLRGPVRTQNMITQKMSNSKIITQKIPNLHVCSTDESEYKGIEPKRINISTCSTQNSK